MNKLRGKETLLLYLYKVFDAYVESNFRMACAKGCALCCTQNVTLTTIEAHLVVKNLRQSGHARVLTRLNTSNPALFRPRFTINDLALACFRQQEPPDEEPGPDIESCPLLVNNLCLAYEARPFACRSFLSLETCQPGGQANVTSSLVSVITACQQIIEHLDAGGFFGNLTDLLFWLDSSDNAKRYYRGEVFSVPGLILTKPLPGFLIPPEDSALVRPFLARLLNGDLDGESFLVKMKGLRGFAGNHNEDAGFGPENL